MNKMQKPTAVQTPLGIGWRGEDVAADFLKKKGYKILERNYRVYKNEIDIIASDDRYFVFCEVKARKQTYGLPTPYGRPASAVTKEKQKHLIAAAQAFARHHMKDGKRFRFDVIEIYLNADGSVGHIHHIENAFRA